MYLLQYSGEIKEFQALVISVPFVIHFDPNSKNVSVPLDSFRFHLHVISDPNMCT